MADLVTDLGAKCDRRTAALMKAVDALEEMLSILVKSKRKWDDNHRHLYTICDKTLEQIETTLEVNGEPNGKL